MRDTKLNKLIMLHRGQNDAETYSRYSLSSPQILAETAREILAMAPPLFGAFAMLSAGWASLLRSCGIPAIAVAGDLNICGTKVFKCNRNLPVAGNSGKAIIKSWDGHCWIEIDGCVGDLSIFRTAYAIKAPSVLNQFIVNKFGQGRGMLLSPTGQLQTMGMDYVPKYVLNDAQINGLVAGLFAHIDGKIKVAPRNLES
jgi:hypothetical protein